MILLHTLLTLLLVQSLTLTMLGASAALARLGGDRRAATEAALMLESVLARARVDHQVTLASLAPGQLRTLSATPPPGWIARVTASREGSGDLVWLVVSVERRNPFGATEAAGRGTLILARTAADTAIVIDSRPRF
jgi:hypothetical protein